VLLHFEKFEQYEYYKKIFDKLKVKTPELIGLKFKGRLDSEILYLYLRGSDDQILKFTKEISQLFKKHKKYISEEHQMVYYLNLSILSFKIDRAALSVDFTQQFINTNWGNTRKDLQQFVELYHLCFHFANKNYRFVYNRAMVVYLRLRRKYKLYKIEVALFTFFKQSPFEKASASEITESLTDLKKRLLSIMEADEKEKAFNENYFDYILWIEKCISNA